MSLTPKEIDDFADHLETVVAETGIDLRANIVSKFCDSSPEEQQRLFEEQYDVNFTIRTIAGHLLQIIQGQTNSDTIDQEKLNDAYNLFFHLLMGMHYSTDIPQLQKKYHDFLQKHQMIKKPIN